MAKANSTGAQPCSTNKPAWAPDRVVSNPCQNTDFYLGWGWGGVGSETTRERTPGLLRRKDSVRDSGAETGWTSLYFCCLCVGLTVGLPPPQAFHL